MAKKVNKKPEAKKTGKPSKAAAKKNPVKKAARKKAAKKKASSKKKAAAMPEAVAAAPPFSGNCFCMEKDGLFFCMKKQPNGSFRECPTTGPFETMEECQEASC